MKQTLKKLMGFEDITMEEAAKCMGEIMDGRATPAQIAAFVTALGMKGETVDEIAGCARVMRERASRVRLKEDAMDVVGTGGDGANTFNVSTCSAFVGGRGHAGRQTREPRDVQPLRERRRAREPGHRHLAGPGAGRSLLRTDRDVLHVRAGTTLR